MRCVHCPNSMTEATYEGVLVHTCDRCGGEFITGDDLAHIVQTREERFAPDLQAALAEQRPQAGVPAEVVAHHQCPACAVPMRTINYGHDSGVHVDRCDECHGVWLDHEELEKVQSLSERWSDEAPAQIQAIASELDQARREAAARTSGAFAGSRFAFVNALINKVLDSAA